jgi:hypothetical protein
VALDLTINGDQFFCKNVFLFEILVVWFFIRVMVPLSVLSVLPASYSL